MICYFIGYSPPSGMQFIFLTFRGLSPTVIDILPLRGINTFQPSPQLFSHSFCFVYYHFAAFGWCDAKVPKELNLNNRGQSPRQVYERSHSPAGVEFALLFIHHHPNPRYYRQIIFVVHGFCLDIREIIFSQIGSV
jgi:hypothetical protein